ncbi:ML2 [Symbiodinium natans]|uniref:ML2 protein n=1 Tax=Symbiodinium natans TaxID=878477 RepID=A0A812RDA9_9DINO|nr:ML2 [Symbiodinium natans]
MIRNIPTEYTQDELIMEVSEVMGSPHFFDFFYLPWDTQNDCNIGYVFVNFPDPAAAQNAVRAFSNYHFRQHDSKKVGKVSPAHIQGLENNLRHLQDRAVVLGNHPCSPIVMWKGQKVELSLIFQELRTQDTLRKFESGHSSSPGHLAAAQNDLAQAAAEALKGPAAPPPVVNVGETFADLLDRAAGLSRSQGAVMNPGLVMPYMQRAAPGMQQGGTGMLSPPGSVGSNYSIVTGQGGASPAAAAYNRMMAAGAQGYGSQPGLGQVVNMLQSPSVPCQRPPGSDKGVSMGPPPGQFFARKPEQMSAPSPSSLNASAAPWPSPQDLAAIGLVADPNLYGMMQNRSACQGNQAWNVEEDIFGGDEQDGTPYDSRTPAVVSPHSWSGSPTAPPGLAPPPGGAHQLHDGGSQRSMLSPPSSASGRHAQRPGLQSGCTSASTSGNGSPELMAPAAKPESAAVVSNLAPNNVIGVKEITMKSADQNLLDKFMAKFGSP